MKNARLIPVALALLLVGCGGNTVSDDDLSIYDAAIQTAKQAEAVHYREVQTSINTEGGTLEFVREIWQDGDDFYRSEDRAGSLVDWLYVDGQGWVLRDDGTVEEVTLEQMGETNWQQDFSMDSYAEKSLEKEGDTVTLTLRSEPYTDESGMTTYIETVCTFDESGDTPVIQTFDLTVHATLDGEETTSPIETEILDFDAEGCRAAIEEARSRLPQN